MESTKDAFVRLKMTVLCTLVSLLFTGSALAQKPKNALDVMTFADNFACNDKFPHHSFCEAVEFKPWSEEDKKLVSFYLSNIRDPRLAFFLKTIQDKGITKIHRVSYSSSWFNNISVRRVEFTRSADRAILWVNPVTQVIGFTDAFFKGTGFMDPYAQIERKQLNVLHELAHVFDIAQGHISSEAAFQEAAGWRWNGKEYVLRNVDYEKVKNELQSILDLVKNGQAPDAYCRDRELGVKYGFPTVYSMVNSHESFAEILTYLILDPTAESYLSKDLVRYFHGVLLPQKP